MPYRIKETPEVLHISFYADSGTVLGMLVISITMIGLGAALLSKLAVILYGIIILPLFLMGVWLLFQTVKRALGGLNMHITKEQFSFKYGFGSSNNDISIRAKEVKSLYIEPNNAKPYSAFSKALNIPETTHPAQEISMKEGCLMLLHADGYKIKIFSDTVYELDILKQHIEQFLATKTGKPK